MASRGSRFPPSDEVLSFTDSVECLGVLIFNDPERDLRKEAEEKRIMKMQWGRDMPQNESTDKGNYRTETTLFFNHSLEQT